MKAFMAVVTAMLVLAVLAYFFGSQYDYKQDLKILTIEANLEKLKPPERKFIRRVDTTFYFRSTGRDTVITVYQEGR